ncbi:MAG: hypothetical protein R3D01_13350 [Hyphomicrobiales bacterium]
MANGLMNPIGELCFFEFGDGLRQNTDVRFFGAARNGASPVHGKLEADIAFLRNADQRRVVRNAGNTPGISEADASITKADLLIAALLQNIGNVLAPSGPPTSSSWPKTKYSVREGCSPP